MKCSCPDCSNDIPESARKDARFCSPSCRVKAARLMKSQLDTPPPEPEQKPAKAPAPAVIKQAPKPPAQQGESPAVPTRNTGESRLPSAYLAALSRARLGSPPVDLSKPQS